MADAALFTRRRHRPLVRQVTDHLRRRIVGGDLWLGRQLPSVKRLAALYGVSVPTMYAAMQPLIAMGLLRASHGVGTFVGTSRGPAMTLVHAWLEASSDELIAVRQALDERAATAAARLAQGMPQSGRRPSHRLLDARFLAGERSLNRRGATAESFVIADLAFHRQILEIQGPDASLQIGLYDRVVDRLLPHLEASAGTQSSDDTLDRCHIDLAVALSEGNAVEAGRLGRAIARREADATRSSLG